MTVSARSWADRSSDLVGPYVCRDCGESFESRSQCHSHLQKMEHMGMTVGVKAKDILDECMTEGPDGGPPPPAHLSEHSPASSSSENGESHVSEKQNAELWLNRVLNTKASQQRPDKEHFPKLPPSIDEHPQQYQSRTHQRSDDGEGVGGPKQAAFKNAIRDRPRYNNSNGGRAQSELVAEKQVTEVWVGRILQYGKVTANSVLIGSNQMAPEGISSYHFAGRVMGLLKADPRVELVKMKEFGSLPAAVFRPAEEVAPDPEETEQKQQQQLAEAVFPPLGGEAQQTTASSAPSSSGAQSPPTPNNPDFQTPNSPEELKLQQQKPYQHAAQEAHIPAPAPAPAPAPEANGHHHHQPTNDGGQQQQHQQPPPPQQRQPQMQMQPQPASAVPLVPAAALSMAPPSVSMAPPALSMPLQAASMAPPQHMMPQKQQQQQHPMMQMQQPVFMPPPLPPPHHQLQHQLQLQQQWVPVSEPMRPPPGFAIPPQSQHLSSEPEKQPSPAKAKDSQAYSMPVATSASELDPAVQAFFFQRPQRSTGPEGAVLQRGLALVDKAGSSRLRECALLGLCCGPVAFGGADQHHQHHGGFSEASDGSAHHHGAQQHEEGEPTALFLNTQEPFCLIAAGAAGSGKSHTIACVLESCLVPFAPVTRLPRSPMSALVLHYDEGSGAAGSPSSACEAAGLVVPFEIPGSAVAPPALPKERLVVLASPGYYRQRRALYADLHRGCAVRPLLLRWSALSADHIRKLLRLPAELRPSESGGDSSAAAAAAEDEEASTSKSSSPLRAADNSNDQRRRLQQQHQVPPGASAILELLRRYQRQAALPQFPEFLSEARSLLEKEEHLGGGAGGGSSSLSRRLELLEQFVAESPANADVRAAGAGLEDVCGAGSLVVADLTDPLLGKAEAGAVFQVLVEQYRALPLGGPGGCGKLLAVDEAHRLLSTSSGGSGGHMMGGSSSSSSLSSLMGSSDSLGLGAALVSAARQGRRDGLRLAVATEAPEALAPELLELATVAVIHRLQSPQGLAHLERKLPQLRGPARASCWEALSGLGQGQALVHAAQQSVSLGSGSGGALGKNVHLATIRPRLTAGTW